MNSLQALAIAAAALAISGDPWTCYLARAEARLTAFVAHAEMLVAEFTAEAVGDITRAPCAEADYADERWAKAKHALPDTSIHLASRAARM